MNDSMAHSGAAPNQLEMPGWKVFANWTSAILSAALFLVAGLWKITDAPATAVYLAQAQVPQSLSLAAALALGITETFAGVLVLVPRFRRWGAGIISLLLVVFMAYVAVNYGALRGAECKCFPWIKRAFGPGFFVSDAVMLLLSVTAGAWAKRSEGLRGAALILGAVAVCAFVSYGLAAAQQTGAQAPESILVDGKPFSMRSGKVFVYFFDPECMHCIEAARKMGRMNWGGTRLVLVATVQPQFASQFVEMTNFRGGLSGDVETLRNAFPFAATPAALAIENGRQKALLTQFEGDEPAATLKSLGFVY